MYQYKRSKPQSPATRHSIFFILLPFLWIGFLSGQSEPIHFTRLSLEEGLSQGTVRCILQDSYGFIWIGTNEGLNKYDGRSFKIYKYDPKSSRSLTHNTVRALHEDSNGTLWIGTDGGGLNRYDRETDDFSHWYHNPEKPKTISHNSVLSLWSDGSGLLWIGTFGGGINKFDPKTDEFVRYQHNSDNQRSLSDDRVLTIWGDRSGTLWIGTYLGGLNRLNPISDQFIRYSGLSNRSGVLNGDIVLTILEDRSGILWFGTNSGLNKYDRDTDSFLTYKNLPDDEKSLSHNTVWSLYEDHQGSIWVGTRAGGLNRFNRVSESFSRYQNNPQDESSLSGNGIFSIYEDRSGVLWVGTQANGLNKAHLKRRFFTHHKPLPDNKNSLSSSMILALHEDAEGTLWIGTYQGGLNRLDQKTGVIEHYLFSSDDQYSLSNNTINAILSDRAGNLWFGSAAGLNSYNYTNNRLDRYPVELSSNFITALAEDFEGDLWIGTNNGLNRINSLDASVAQYFNASNDSTSISSNTITTLLIDKVGNLWIGTENNGLNWYDRGKNEFQQYLHRIAVPNSISDNRILSLFVDSQDRFWIGTRRGLNLLDRDSGQFTYYDVQDGFPSSAINGILEDRRGNLWLSTNNGIARFNTNTLSVKHYDVQDGVQDREFNPNANFINSSGKMFFGGVNGFNSFDPENIRDNDYLPPVVLTYLTQNGLDLEPERAKETVKNITLTWPANSFEFEFASLNYTQSERNQQAYILEGLDRDWNYIGEENRGRYTNLSGGNYILKLKGSNNDGLWNPSENVIAVYVVPPIWQRWWFRISILLLITGLISFMYRQRFYRLEKRRKRLELRVQEKAEAAQALQTALSEVELLKNRLQAENIYLRDEIKVQHNFANIITNSRKLKKVLQSVEQVAATDSTVLILGESGTGKELLARAVHNVSARSDRPLVKVDCSTLPANLIESELFGHEKGAFTGAIVRKIGRFELADKGTIFLDEIGDLPLELQTKLLRVLQDNAFERLGNPKTINVDVRVIAATNRDLDKAIEENQFREDLFYRLNVFPIVIPPLRERKGDVELLVNHFVKKYSKKVGKNIKSIPQRVMDILTNYQWPGNVRELENIIERAVIISAPGNFTLGDWSSKLESNLRPITSTLVTLEELEKNYIIQILDHTGWRVSGEQGAAKILDMNPKTLESRMNKLGIKRKI